MKPNPNQITLFFSLVQTNNAKQVKSAPTKPFNSTTSTTTSNATSAKTYQITRIGNAPVITSGTNVLSITIMDLPVYIPRMSSIRTARLIWTSNHIHNPQKDLDAQTNLVNMKPSSQMIPVLQIENE